MDRTHILNNGVIHANKKLNGLQKCSETFLCDEIHDNLRALALVIPLSDEFKEIFERGMFIKPNAKAFPHVMKYLFMICDATDFKKKFCWPIYNKAAEATFRNATLELLNKLNGKYSLGLGEMRNKILIFPGGMDFMRVIYELTRLSMQIVLKRNGTNGAESMPSVTLAGAKRHLDDLQDLYDFVMDFKRQIEEYSVKLKTNTETLEQLLHNLVGHTNITSKDILEDKFTESWQQFQNHIVKRGISPHLECLIKFQGDCQALEDKVSAIFKQQTIKFDARALASFSTEMQQQHPEKYHELDRIVENGQINLDNILQALPMAIPTMLQMIETHKPRSAVAMAYESKRLDILSKKADELLQKTVELGVASDVPRANYHGVNVAPQFQTIQSMILSTPTISHDAIRRAENVGIQPKRIALLENSNQLRPASSKLNIASKPLNSIQSSVNEEAYRSGQKQFLSPGRIFGREPKSKLDPMTILKSIKKKEKKDKLTEKHTPNVHFKPKLMNFGQRIGLRINQHEQSQPNDILIVPDFSSTLLNNSLDLQFSMNEQINTSLAKSIAKNEYDHDLNRSPSSRIEPLIVSKLHSNDIKPTKFIEKDSNIQNSNQHSALGERVFLGSKLMADSFAISGVIDCSNDENNQNITNKNVFNLNSMIDENDESLLNISDRILDNLNDSELI